MCSYSPSGRVPLVSLCVSCVEVKSLADDRVRTGVCTPLSNLCCYELLSTSGFLRFDYIITMRCSLHAFSFAHLDTSVLSSAKYGGVVVLDIVCFTHVCQKLHHNSAKVASTLEFTCMQYCIVLYVELVYL